MLIQWLLMQWLGNVLLLKSCIKNFFLVSFCHLRKMFYINEGFLHFLNLWPLTSYAVCSYSKYRYYLNWKTSKENNMKRNSTPRRTGSSLLGDYWVPFMYQYFPRCPGNHIFMTWLFEGGIGVRHSEWWETKKPGIKCK